jgi:transcriptional regulatory protein RtcR
MKKTVVFGFLGTKLDAIGGLGKNPQRWRKWRPTVGLCQQADMPVHRLELLHDPRNKGLVERIVADIGEASPATEVRRVELALANPWDFEEVYTRLLDFVRHYAFDVENEEYLVHITTGTHVAQICWFLLAESRYVPGRLLQTAPRSPRAVTGADTAAKSGADAPEPGSMAGSMAGGAAGHVEIIDLDLSRYDQIAQRFRREQADTVSRLKSGIATRNAAFNTMIEQIERVAGRSRAPILLTGPTGAGKSFLARRIYELKRERQRLAGRFVEVNCATLRGESAMSALFGHVKGAFTGAQNARAGLLRSADGGVLFLDETGEPGQHEQAMLLKAIEDKRFPCRLRRRRGGDKRFSTDRGHAPQPAPARVHSGAFREDLYAPLECLPPSNAAASFASLDSAEPHREFHLFVEGDG